jgi:hypothetical protein
MTKEQLMKKIEEEIYGHGNALDEYLRGYRRIISSDILYVIERTFEECTKDVLQILNEVKIGKGKRKKRWVVLSTGELKLPMGRYDTKEIAKARAKELADKIPGSHYKIRRKK